jgi:hypothetical protein
MNDNSKKITSTQQEKQLLLQKFKRKIDHRLISITKLQNILIQQEAELKKYLEEEIELKGQINADFNHKGNL